MSKFAHLADQDTGAPPEGSNGWTACSSAPARHSPPSRSPMPTHSLPTTPFSIPRNSPGGDADFEARPVQIVQGAAADGASCARNDDPRSLTSTPTPTPNRPAPGIFTTARPGTPTRHKPTSPHHPRRPHCQAPSNCFVPCAPPGPPYPNPAQPSPALARGRGRTVIHPHLPTAAAVAAPRVLVLLQPALLSAVHPSPAARVDLDWTTASSDARLAIRQQTEISARRPIPSPVVIY